MGSRKKFSFFSLINQTHTPRLPQLALVPKNKKIFFYKFPRVLPAIPDRSLFYNAKKRKKTPARYLLA
jgi:hypothetical protein